MPGPMNPVTSWDVAGDFAKRVTKLMEFQADSGHAGRKLGHFGAIGAWFSWLVQRSWNMCDAAEIQDVRDTSSTRGYASGNLFFIAKQAVHLMTRYLIDISSEDSEAIIHWSMQAAVLSRTAWFCWVVMMWNDVESINFTNQNCFRIIQL